MKIKRYTAATMREAMQLVKRDHGDDAVILSTKETSSGCEVMAALDPEIEEYRQSVEQASSKSDRYESAGLAATPRNLQAYQAMQGLSGDIANPEHSSREINNRPASHPYSNQSQHDFHRPVDKIPEPNVASEHAVNFAQKEEMHKMASEIQAMRSLLENQMAGLAWGQLEHSKPEQIDLLKRLLALGIGWELCQKLVDSVDAKDSGAWSHILAAMEKQVEIDNKDILEVGGIYALVGPTGVGKTTTIAKIASRFVMRNHPNDLALITTDSYKVGAQAQLKIFADLINVPVHVAKTQEELYALLSSFANKKLVLIDTAGMSQKALQLSQQLTSGSHGNVPIKNYLVMSATSSLTVMQQIVEAFNEVVLSGCVLTKVDEAASLGNILTILIQQSLPISYVSNGQRVPEDIEMVRARDLIDQAIVLGQQNSNVTDEQAFKMGIAKEISNAQ
ncbi:flagellar biosynthesis protein FlhF [Thiomicrorhabdus indica]|uniref:flagellar biosynthesis protein FlhF n=1 Tax=Thiomicrorhabdus indica TaxID=2267253 RepID=UPI002AA82B44|nr:flagellar biosynthesis protein FlhF [Thiomicrorhabdus indica]